MFARPGAVHLLVGKPSWLGGRAHAEGCLASPPVSGVTEHRSWEEPTVDMVQAKLQKASVEVTPVQPRVKAWTLRSLALKW